MTHEEYESKSQMKRVETLKAEEKQMTHEELLAEINERIEELHDAEVCDGFIHALRAVVELHQPFWTFPYGSNNSIPICLQCREGEFEADYPCPTIQAIEKELG